MIKGVTVYVTNDNVEKALRKLRKNVMESKRLDDAKEHEAYTKPTTRRKIKAAAAKARWQRHIKQSELPKPMF